MSMDSRLHASPSAKTRALLMRFAAAHKQVLSSSCFSDSGLIPIRAPPTLQDEDEDEDENGEYSDSESDSRKVYILSNSTSSCSSRCRVSESEFEFRTSVLDPELLGLEEIDDVEKPEFSRSFVAETDGSLEAAMKEEVDGEVNANIVVAERGVEGSNLSVLVPKAKLSGDDDDGLFEQELEDMESELEEYGVSGPVRLPEIAVSERIVVAPWVKVSATDEEEDNDEVQGADYLNFKQIKPSSVLKIVESVLDKFLVHGNQVSSTVDETTLVKDEAAPVVIDEDEDEDCSVKMGTVVDSLSIWKNSAFDMKSECICGEKHELNEVTKEGIELSGEVSHEQSMVDMENDIFLKAVAETKRESVFDVFRDTIIKGTSIMDADVESSKIGCHTAAEFREIAGRAENCYPNNGHVEEIDESNMMCSNFDYGELENVEKHVEEDSAFPKNRNRVDDATESAALDQGIDNGKPELRKDPEDDLEDGLYHSIAAAKVEYRDGVSEGHQVHYEDVTLQGDDVSKINDNGTLEGAPFGVSCCPEFVRESHNIAFNTESDATVFESRETSVQIMKELDCRSTPSISVVAESFEDHSEKATDSFVAAFHEIPDGGHDIKRKEFSDSEDGLLKASTTAESDVNVHTDYFFTNSFGLLFLPPYAKHSSERNHLDRCEKLEKLPSLGMKFLRLVQSLGLPLQNYRVTENLHGLACLVEKQSGMPVSKESTDRTAVRHGAANGSDLCLNILVLGKTGVGKSATINSIFGEEKSKVNAFEPGTTTLKEIVGTINGVKIRILDTPGLRSAMEHAVNKRILATVKNSLKKFHPTITLYVDRLDSHGKDLSDLPLIQLITDTLGPSIWRSTILTLTHAACTLPDGPLESPLKFYDFVAQHCQNVQVLINQVADGPCVMDPHLMHSVFLVENQP